MVVYNGPFVCVIEINYVSIMYFVAVCPNDLVRLTPYFKQNENFTTLIKLSTKRLFVGH